MDIDYINTVNPQQTLHNQYAGNVVTMRTIPQAYKLNPKLFKEIGGRGAFW